MIDPMYDVEADLGTQITLASIEQAQRHAQGQALARDFLNTLATTYGVAELVVSEALKDASPDFVRLTIELVHYGMGSWEWQLSYRFMLAAFNNLTSN